MEAQMHRPHGAHEEQQHQHAGLQSVIEGEGEGEHHHEKTSVIKKVKAKAKKIKESIKHLGHEHGHEHGHTRDHDEDEEEDEDEEMVDDSEVHGGPKYESTVIRSATVPQQDVGLGPKSAVNLENPTIKGEDRVDKATDQDTIRRFVQGQEHTRRAGESIAKPTAMEAHVPEYKRVPPTSETYGTKVSDLSDVHGQERNVGEPGVRFGAPASLEEDPDAPKDQPEAMDPPNYQSKVTDPTGHGGEEAGIAPLVSSFGKMNVKDEGKTESTSTAESEQKSYTGSHDQFAPQPIPEGFDPSKPEEIPRDPIDGKPSGRGSYTDKISSAASSITGKAISAKNVVASKLGYGGTEAPKSQEMDEGKPSEQGSYTDKITHATSAIADKAAAAKNVVASKLGYTGTEGTKTHATEATEASTDSTKSATPTDYAHKAAAAVTGTLAPVYEKVAGVGSSVMSKVQGIGTGHEGRTGTAHSSHEGKAKGADKGVSMKEYLAEKFRPGEEDKALSEVISETLHKQKEKTGKTGEAKPIEKVTESEEVARRLGTGKENQREGDDALIAGSESSGNGVVDRLTNAVTSWLGKGSESQTSQGSPGTPFVDTRGSSSE